MTQEPNPGRIQTHNILTPELESCIMLKCFAMSNLTVSVVAMTKAQFHSAAAQKGAQHTTKLCLLE